MLNLFVEYLGTFILISVILIQGKALPIAVALAAAIYLGGGISGGNFNPAVSLAILFQNKMNLTTFVQYVLAQLLGAFSAYHFSRFAVKHAQSL